MKTRLTCICIGVCLNLFAGPTLGTPLDIGEFDARAMSMGGAQTAASRDYSAAFYNPGALTQSRKNETGFGFMVTLPPER